MRRGDWRGLLTATPSATNRNMSIIPFTWCRRQIERSHYGVLLTDIGILLMINMAQVTCCLITVKRRQLKSVKAHTHLVGVVEEVVHDEQTVSVLEQSFASNDTKLVQVKSADWILRYQHVSSHLKKQTRCSDINHAATVINEVITTMVIRPLDDRTYCARSAFTHLRLWWKAVQVLTASLHSQPAYVLHL